MLVILQCMLFWPIAYRQIQNGINMITKDTDNAAKLLSKNKFDSIILIYLPSCKKVLKTSLGFCFAASLGDATLPLVLSIPRFNSLALYTYQLASAYRFDQACACGLILTVFCIYFCINIHYIIRRYQSFVLMMPYFFAASGISEPVRNCGMVRCSCCHCFGVIPK